MKKALCFLLASGLVSSAFAIEPDKLFEITSPSVWTVKTFNADNTPLGMGSAVVIAPGKLLTNCHVLAKSKRFEVGQAKKSYPGKLEYLDTKRDLCQISVADLSAPAVPLGNDDELKVGQKVYALGNPQGLELTLSNGLISALRKDKNGKLELIQTTAPISQGSSGGGLFDEQGRLIGITTMMVLNSQNLNFAVPASGSKELPARSQIEINRMNTQERVANIPQFRGGKELADHNFIVPSPSGYAWIHEEVQVPIEKDQRPVWRKYITDASPKAAAISKSGVVYIFSGSNSMKDALDLCGKIQQSRCWLYAVDNEVVWTEDEASRFAFMHLKPKNTSTP